jgi:hypothetical protein
MSCARQITSSPARSRYAATLFICSYLQWHDQDELTASPHDAGQLIIRIRAKWRFLTPTKEKSWQSLLLGRSTQLIKRTLTQRWRIYKYSPSLEGHVFNSHSLLSTIIHQVEDSLAQNFSDHQVRSNVASWKNKEIQLGYF